MKLLDIFKRKPVETTEETDDMYLYVKQCVDSAKTQAIELVEQNKWWATPFDRIEDIIRNNDAALSPNQKRMINDYILEAKKEVHRARMSIDLAKFTTGQYQSSNEKEAEIRGKLADAELQRLKHQYAIAQSQTLGQLQNQGLQAQRFQNSLTGIADVFKGSSS